MCACKHRRLTSAPRKTALNLFKANYLSFHDNKYLNNGIGWSINCAMNANEISPKINFRMNRIKIVSRIVRLVTLLLFIFTLVNSMLFIVPSWFPTAIKEHPVHLAINFLVQIVLWVWYWKLAKLFHFYECGLIFATETIRCIKTLGLLCVMNWLLASASRLSSHPAPLPPQFPVPPGVEVLLVKTSFSISFFSFSIAGINFGPLLAGVVIVIIAWIMDEGRKIQEEQELTV